MILQSSFFVFWGKEKFSALRQGNGDRLPARKQKDSSSLPAHDYGAAVRWDLDAEGTHGPVCPCLPILWMRNLRSKKGSDLPKIRVLGLPELFFFFFFKHIFKGELPKLRGMTSWMVKVVGAWESSDTSICTSHVCTTISESVSACMNRQPEECPWNISRYFYQLLKRSRDTDCRQCLGKTSEWVLQGVKEQ